MLDHFLCGWQSSEEILKSTTREIRNKDKLYASNGAKLRGA